MEATSARIAKGRELERQIGELFRHHGYAVELNAFREGSSGVRHEIDVLATRADALTESVTFVECKAWGARIPKDVVAKARYVMQDVGINHGIIVAPGGWTVSAEAAAREAGIELWGPTELSQRLGARAVAGLTAAPRREARGLPATVPAGHAERCFAREARRFLGRREILHTGLLWTPWHVLRLSLSTERGVLRKRLVSERRLSMYDGLDGTLVLPLREEPRTAAVDIGSGALAVERRPASLSSEIIDALAKHRSVTTEAARQRHADRLAAAGIELPLSAVTVEDHTTLHIPFWVAVLRDRSGDRVVATGAHEKDGVDQSVGALLTPRVGAVADALS